MTGKFSRNAKLVLAFTAATSLGLGGCASFNGGMTLNKKSSNEESPFCQSLGTLEQRINTISEGMSISEGLSIMAQTDYDSHSGQVNKYLKPLDREGIFRMLYPANARLEGSNMQMEENRTFFKPLKGLFFTCSSSHKKGGLTFSGVQSTTRGYHYNVGMVIKDGKFFDKPVISGGYNTDESRENYFEFLTRGARNKVSSIGK